MPMEEVPPTDLPAFLEHCRSLGYSLIGVEQTASSTRLDCFKFPRKTVLLLGAEKEGIPAPLISLLDSCVEIPQAGVIRSLNVHVSGAICVWEYAGQYPM
eukprot:GDKI01049311.1.p1 GENE.GDKI01049311.1~~GDKI01049311.1.p1  ORF type:complete len:100 (+),score=26.85 GDKI01049311.1:214-513(+)